MATRQPIDDIHPLFAERWSPRAFDRSPIAQDELDLIFTAAGRAPSAFNYQPWRFVYAHRGDANWSRFLAQLNEFNRGWAQHASALVFILSDSTFEQAEATSTSYSHSFDAGAAWAQLALQATAMGFHAHAMTGIDFDGARSELGIPDHFRVEAAVAIGRRASPDTLPGHLRDKERPSGRRPTREIAFAGRFSG